MTIKLNSLARWARLPETDAIVFEGTDVDERRVRIDFNLEGVTTFFIGDERRGENFLCTIGPGLETVEFNVSGTFSVYAEKGSGAVHYHCSEHEPTFSEVVDPKIFTKIAQRRHRNPELEEMMWRMNANIERRMAQQADEIKAEYERRLKEAEDARATETNVVAGTPPSSGGSEVPTQGAEPAKPSEAPSARGTSEQPGGGGGGSV